jgi:hypothetical protein
MAAYVKYEVFVQHLMDKVHDLFGTTDTLKVALTNSAPVVATHAVLADVTQISGGTGYTTGGSDSQNDSTRTGGTVTMTGTDIVWTASGSMGALRYAVLYNDTPTSPADPLIAYWDYGSSVTLSTGETFTVDFGASINTIS